MHFLAPKARLYGFSRLKGGWLVFPRPPGRLYGFIYTGGAAAYHHPLNPMNQPASGGPNPLNPETASR